LYLLRKGCFKYQLPTLKAGYKQLLSTSAPNVGGTNSFLNQLPTLGVQTVALLSHPYIAGINSCFINPFPTLVVLTLPTGPLFQGRLYLPLCVLNPDCPAESTAFAANSCFVAATLLLAARSNVASLVRRSNKKKSFTYQWVNTSVRE